MRRTAIGVFTLLLVAATLFGQDDHPQGPPQYLTRPILLHVSEDGLEHGHFVFTEGAAIPSPLAPNLGLAVFTPATFAGTALVTNEIDVSTKPDSYEGETTGAAAGLFLVGGSNRVYPGNCAAAGGNQGVGVFGDCSPLSYVSTDGLTWTKGSVPRIIEGTNFGICFDPGIDYDKNGTFYYSYGCAPLSGNYPNGVFVASSTDGTAWTSKPHVTFNNNRFFDDKYYIAVDRSNSTFANRIYVSWDRNQSNNQILYIAYSSNGGATWSAPVKVNDGTSKFERVIGAYPAVDHNTGVVYDSWHDYARNIIYVDKSTNGGATWGTDRAAATTHAGFGTDIGCVGGRSQGPAHALKVGPSGTLYLVYADPTTGGHGFDILLTKSTNGGTTWSAPITLNDDGGPNDQFHPTLSVESNGLGGDKITVSFYDRRDDPADCLAYVYATNSTDNGATWSANVRATSVQSNFNGNSNGPGDYSSSTPGTVILGGAWWFHCDHRPTNPETASGGAFDVYSGKVQ